MTGDQTPPAGWYPDNGMDAPAGQRRYWDGSAWTEHTTAPTEQRFVLHAGTRSEAINMSPWPCGVSRRRLRHGGGLSRAFDVVREAALAPGGVIDAGLSGDPGGL